MAPKTKSNRKATSARRPVPASSNAESTRHLESCCERLRKLRISRKLSREEAARGIGSSEATLRNMEVPARDYRPPVKRSNEATRLELASQFHGVELGYLLAG